MASLATLIILPYKNRFVNSFLENFCKINHVFLRKRLDKGRRLWYNLIRSVRNDAEYAVKSTASETTLRVKIKGKFNMRVWRNWQTR